MKRNSFWLILSFFLIFCNVAKSSPTHPILKEESVAVVLNEQRDETYRKLLSASVRISSNGGAGSGTICYYDYASNKAYVISCGHLWSGNKRYIPEQNTSAKILVWYHNDKKLETPETLDAEVLFWSNDRGYDVSLLRFEPSWKPVFFPACSRPIEKGQVLNSLGCDGGKEVARYEVIVKELRHPDIITIKNSPRPGRSGGGLITNEGELVGICWGTSDISSGDGIGYFTPFHSIKKVFSDNDHSWILDARRKAQIIPIKDWTPGIRKFEFVPMPNLAINF